MSQFQQYQISQTCLDHVKQSGFDARDPHRVRQAIQPQRVMNQPIPQQAPVQKGWLARAKELLGVRDGQSLDRGRVSRCLLWPLVFSCWFGLEASTPAWGEVYEEFLQPVTVCPPCTTTLGDAMMKDFNPMPQQTAEDTNGDMELFLFFWCLVLASCLLALGLSHQKISRCRAFEKGLFTAKATEDTTKSIPSPLRLSCATRTGRVRSENQDAIQDLRFDAKTVGVVLCDGAGGVVGGRQAAQNAVAVISGELHAVWQRKQRLRIADLETAIQTARDKARQQNLSGVTTALLAVVQNNTLIYASLGDGAISLLWPDGMVNHLQALHHTAGQPSNIINAYIGDGCDVAPRVGWQRLESNSTVMLMSDGAADLFPFEDYALKRTEHHEAWLKQGEDYADQLLQQLELARDEQGAYLHHDNMSLGLIAYEEQADV